MAFPSGQNQFITSKLWSSFGKKNTGKAKLNYVFFIFFSVLLLFGCDYDQAEFYYADISPKAPHTVKITPSSTTATITWIKPDDSAYPLPDYLVYTISSGATNLSATISDQSIRQAEITGLNPATDYSTFIRASNRAGIADSSTTLFKTK